MAIVLRISNKQLQLDENVELPENADVIIGRSEECDYTIRDERCSSKHLQISLANNELWAIDLNSKNGTLLDKSRIEEEQLFIGSKIEIGNSKIAIDSKHMTSEEKRAFTRKKTAAESGRNNNDLSICDESFKMEFTNAGMSINQDNGYNDGKKGLAINKKKSR